MPRIAKSVDPAAVTSDPMLSVVEAAAYVNLPIGTLDNWRSTKRVTIPFYRVGGRVFYRRSDLDEFLKSCRVAG